MSKRLNLDLSFIIVFAVGLIWIHLDSVVAIVAFSLVITLPLLALVLLTCLVFVIKGKLMDNKKLILRGLRGLMLLLVFIFSPILSVKVVDRLNRSIAEGVINKLEAYRIENGYYPNSLSAIGINYYPAQNYLYDSRTSSYTIKFRNGALITTKYSSKDKKWTDYGWND